MAERRRYTCTEYRQEMILLSLQHRLHQQDVSESEKKKIINEIKKIESLMCMADVHANLSVNSK